MLVLKMIAIFPFEFRINSALKIIKNLFFSGNPPCGVFGGICSSRRSSLQLPTSPNVVRCAIGRTVLRGRKVRIRLASGRRLQQIRPRGAEGRRQYAGILLRRSSRRPPTNCHLLRGRRLRFCCRSQLRRRSPIGRIPAASFVPTAKNRIKLNGNIYAIIYELIYLLYIFILAQINYFT